MPLLWNKLAAMKCPSSTSTCFPLTMRPPSSQSKARFSNPGLWMSRRTLTGEPPKSLPKTRDSSAMLVVSCIENPVVSNSLRIKSRDRRTASAS